MSEQFANNAQSTLSSSIDGSVTTLTVVSGTPFSSSGTFRIIIDSEIMLVTSRSANTLTVVRGSEGTVATSHNSGANVTQIITAGALSQFQTDVIASANSSAVSVVSPAVRPIFTTILNNVASNGSYPSTTPTNWSANYTPTKSGLVLITATCQGGQSSSGTTVTANLLIDNVTVTSVTRFSNTNGIHVMMPTILYSTTLSLTSHTIKITLTGSAPFADSNDFATIFVQEFA